MNADAPVSRLDLRGIREVGQPEAGGQRRAYDTAQAIGRVRAGEHEVVFELLQRGREDVHGRANVRAANSVVHHVNRTRGAHGQRLAQRLCATRGPKGQQRHIATVLLGQLERLLEQVLVIAVGLGCA